MTPNTRHCEERSDAAIHDTPIHDRAADLARNDGVSLA
jgi:hypothetical protein